MDINQFFAAVMGIKNFSLNDERGRKWFEDHEPETWEIYVHETFNRRLPIKLTERLKLVLDINNFHAYLVEHFEDWAYEECPVCYGSGCQSPDEGMTILECSACNGSGRICKYPEAEKIRG